MAEPPGTRGGRAAAASRAPGSRTGAPDGRGGVASRPAKGAVHAAASHGGSSSAPSPAPGGGPRGAPAADLRSARRPRTLPLLAPARGVASRAGQPRPWARGGRAGRPWAVVSEGLARAQGTAVGGGASSPTAVP